MKACSTCRVPKPLSDFGVQTAKSLGVRSSCTPCYRAYLKERRVALRQAELATLVPCDCGRLKPLPSEACTSCESLDSRGTIGCLVSALRVLGGSATVHALIEEMQIADTNVYRAIRMAEAEGRLVRVVQHEDTAVLKDSRGRMYARRPPTRRGMANQGRMLQSSPLYVLIDRVAS